MIKIIALEKKYLLEASKLANKIFPNEDILPGREFEVSLSKRKLKFFMENNTDVATLDYFNSLEYFLAINENEKVLGIIGLYTLSLDKHNSYWLGWLCVNEKYRRQGVGKILLNYAILEVKRRGKKYLNLYTSTNPNESIAQIMYEKHGFKKTNRKHLKQGNYEIFFRKKIL